MLSQTIPAAVHAEMVALARWQRACPVELPDSVYDSLAAVERDLCERGGVDPVAFAVLSVDGEGSLWLVAADGGAPLRLVAA